MTTSSSGVADELLPPGTVHLVRVDKEKPGGKDVVLIPKPSSDPDDPLNWSRLRKFTHVFFIYAYTFTTGVGGTSTYSILVDISNDTGLSLTQLNLGTGFLFLLAGWGNLAWQPLALSIGRRPVYLASLLGCLAMSEWVAHVDSFPQWAAARVLYGFMVAPVEVLPEISVPDIFFAHERGAYIGYYSMVLNASNFIAPLIAGFVNESVGWRWVQHWCALLLALNFLLALVFQEESMYHRGTVEAEAAADDGDRAREVTLEQSGTAASGKGLVEAPAAADVSAGTIAPAAPKSFWRRMTLWERSQLTWRQALTVAWRPVLLLFQFPNIAWASWQYAFALAWYNVYNATASMILSAPPYSMDSSMVGVTYMAPLLGALIGGVVAGPLSDKFALRLAYRADGVREPEHRLWGMVIFAVVLPAGLWLWGVGAAHGAPLGVLLVGSVFCGFGVVSGGTHAISYSVDCFKEIAGESIVTLILVRNTVSFAFNYGIIPWINQAGLQNTFVAVGIIALVTGVSFLLVIWKGKWWRASCADLYWRYARDQMVQH